MALRKTDYANTVDLKAADERVIRYLKGETLDLEDLVSREGQRLVPGLRRRLPAWLGKAFERKPEK